MPLNLRLPPELDAKARYQARKRFISLNSLICQALANYLQDSPDLSVKVVKASPAPAPVPVVPQPPKPAPVPVQAAPARVLSPPGPHASKAERKAYTAQMRLARKA